MGRIRSILLAAAVGLAVAFTAVPAKADGLQVLSTFNDGNNDQLAVAIYTEGTETVGLVGMITASNQHISITFDKKEMDTFIGIVRQAQGIDSDQWRQAGSFDETGTKSPSHIVVYGGPALQFSLTDPSVGSANFTLNKSDISGFIQALDDAEGKITE